VAELAVVGQDPGFGGGALAQMRAFLDAAAAAGREPKLLYVPHPRFHSDGRGAVLDRVEALRVMRGGRRLAGEVEAARQVWVVATLATHGLAATLCGRPYACWIGTTLASENAGRLPGLSPSRRIALHLNAPALTRVERRVLEGAAQLYATSPSSRDDVARAAGVAISDVRILPLPVDAGRFAPEPDGQWLARLEAPALAFVGRPDDTRKNLALARAALPLIQRRIPNARLHVIGGGVESVVAPLRTASLLLSTSRQEGFGLAVAEALACGVPVVATPSGGPEDILRSSGGGSVLTGFDPAELAETAADLLAEPETLLRMRHAGRAYVEREHSPARLVTLAGAAIEELDGRG